MDRILKIFFVYLQRLANIFIAVVPLKTFAARSNHLDVLQKEVSERLVKVTGKC